ncbi:hypothetical protein, partial [Klebsiella pneumoniae]
NEITNSNGKWPDTLISSPYTDNNNAGNNNSNKSPQQQNKNKSLTVQYKSYLFISTYHLFYLFSFLFHGDTKQTYK